jgi:hypothetical protein
MPWLDQILRLLDQNGFEVLERRDLKAHEISRIARQIRGGNWGRGPWPLSSWLFDETLDTGFFVFRQPEGTKDRQITSWFIASSIRNPITTGLFNALCDYLFKPREVVLTKRRRRCYVHYENISRTGTGYRLLNTMERENAYPYFFYHYLFNEVVATDGAKVVWQRAVLARNNHAKKMAK